MFISIVSLRWKYPPPKNYRQLIKKTTTRRIAQRVFFRVYSFSSDLSLALGVVTRMSSCLARSTILLRFLEDTVWAISAAYTRFCINKTSKSDTLFTKNFLNPLGQTCLVALLLPYPMLGILYCPLKRR